MASTAKSISDLIRSLFIAAAVAGISVCLCVSAVILAVDTKLSTNARISGINESINFSMPTLVESYRFKETSAVSYIIERLRDRSQAQALRLLENFNENCPVDTYMLGDFEICWRAKHVSVARKVIKGTFLVYEIQPQYFVGPLYRQGFLLLALMLFVVYFMLFFAFRSIWKRILGPIQDFHQSLSDPKGFDLKITSELEEMKTLGRAVAQLRQSAQNEAVVRTIAMVFHDVMKPFAVLKGSLQTLRESKSFNEFKTELPKIEADVAWVTRKAQVLMQEVSDYSSELSLDLKSWPLQTVVQEALSEVFDFFDRAPISVCMDWGHQNLVLCDTFRLQRVISNIVINACQASRLEGEIWISSKQVNKRIFIIVGNSGSHVPEASIEKLFEYRFTAGKNRGTGLGLAIAQHIIHAHGGKISVFSSTEKNQVEFEFDLASADELDELSQTFKGTLSRFLQERLKYEKEIHSHSRSEALEEIAFKLKEKYSRPIKVLVIDDDPIDRKSVQKMFLDTVLHGLFEINECADVNLLNTKDFSSPVVFIVDIDLGSRVKNGFDVVSQIREERGKDALIVVCSNQNLIDTIAQAMSVGADAFISKPISRAQFLDVLLKDRLL